MSDENLLVSEELYISCGVEIGTQQKNADMKGYIAKVRNDGLYILNIKKSDERIRIAAKLLSKYDPSQILVVSARQYGQRPIQQFAKAIGAQTIPGHFPPGTLTNPKLSDYREPGITLITDPIGDKQALKESLSTGIPVVSLCDSNNETKFIDWVIPVNNKGRKSLALVYWILSREILKARGAIKTDEEFQLTVEDFETTL